MATILKMFKVPCKKVFLMPPLERPRYPLDFHYPLTVNMVIGLYGNTEEEDDLQSQ
jgi:hypothetical protein